MKSTFAGASDPVASPSVCAAKAGRGISPTTSTSVISADMTPLSLCLTLPMSLSFFSTSTLNAVAPFCEITRRLPEAGNGVAKGLRWMSQVFRIEGTTALEKNVAQHLSECGEGLKPLLHVSKVTHQYLVPLCHF